MKNTHTIYRLVTSVGIILCLLLPTSVFAVKQSEEKQYRSTPEGEGSLTPKMIRTCISMKKRLDGQAEDAALRLEELEEMNAELKLTEEELLEAEKTLDKDDAGAVAEHNAKIEALKEKLEEYQVKTEEYNAQIKPYSKLEKKLKKLCDNQPYYEDDYQQAKKEMGYGLE